MPATQNKHRKIERAEVFEQWAKYRQGRIDGALGWPKKTILGKLRDDMPTNLCPVCIGREKPIQNCPVCGGDGRIKLEARNDKASPAFIRGNGNRQSYDDDPQSQRVDWLVCTELTEDQREVLISAFCRNGTQTQKAREIGISQQKFSMIQDEAMAIVESRLFD